MVDMNAKDLIQSRRAAVVKRKRHRQTLFNIDALPITKERELKQLRVSKLIQKIQTLVPKIKPLM